MEAESVQKLYRMDNVVKDNSQQRVTWGSSAGGEGREHTADEGCPCGMDRLGLQTAADWGFGTWHVEWGWTLANPCPAIALGQEELY